jgi:single-stranded DNA-binding protein
MAKSLNKVSLIGTVIMTPESHFSWMQRPICTFFISTQYDSCLRIVAKDDLAIDAQQTLIQGQQVYIKGYIKTYHLEQPAKMIRYITEVIAQEIDILIQKQEPFQAEQTTLPEYVGEML